MATRKAAERTRPATDLVRVRRFGNRGRYDLRTVLSILDAGLVCQVSFEFAGGPMAIPMLYWHDRRRLYLHGSRASRLMREIAGKRVCVSITHIDGLVLARSAFNHSANYRSVCIFGVAQPIEDEQERIEQLRAMMDRVLPGRWDKLRPPKKSEIAATRVLAVPLAEISAKIRSGPPVESARDRTWRVWAGVIPIESRATTPVADDTADGSGDPPPQLAIPPSATR